jgi:dienelactone hydrolase
VVIDKEGYEGARWFSRQAPPSTFSASLPHQGWAAGPDTPLQDAQRAVRLIRSREQADGIDPQRVMVMGFSAGGHVAGSLATRFEASVYEPRDAIDQLSAKPDAAVLMYPVVTMKQGSAHPGSRRNLLGETPSDTQVAKYSLETAPPDAPPPSSCTQQTTLAFRRERAASIHCVESDKRPRRAHIFETGIRQARDLEGSARHGDGNSWGKPRHLRQVLSGQRLNSAIINTVNKGRMVISKKRHSLTCCVIFTAKRVTSVL